MSPGPKTTASAPNSANCGASVPNEIVPADCPVASSSARTSGASPSVSIPPSRRVTLNSQSKSESSARKLSISRRTSSATASGRCPGTGRHSSVKRHSPAMTFLAVPPATSPTLTVV